MPDPIQPSDIREYLCTMPEQARAMIRLFPGNAPLTLFDIGACEGEDSIRYARLFPQARIFAFEPLPLNQEFIRTNFAKFGITHAELVPTALSDRVGTSEFHVSSGEPGERFCGSNWNYGNKSSSLLPPSGQEPMHGWIEFKETITVPTSTLAGFCGERKIGRIDFMHMDVQGAELLVLEGAGKKMRDVTAVWLEVTKQALYRGQPLRTDIRRFMQHHGFALAFECNHDIEGDQFYVNLRHPRVWPWLLRLKLGEFYRRVRFKAGAWKSRYLGPGR